MCSKQHRQDARLETIHTSYPPRKMDANDGELVGWVNEWAEELIEDAKNHKDAKPGSCKH